MIYLCASAYGSYRPIARLRHCAILPFFLTVDRRLQDHHVRFCAARNLLPTLCYIPPTSDLSDTPPLPPGRSVEYFSGKASRAPRRQPAILSRNLVSLCWLVQGGDSAWAGQATHMHGSHDIPNVL